MQPRDPIELHGIRVRLVPLTIDHVDALCQVGLDERIWRWMPARVRDPSGMRAFVQDALDARDAGTALPFATISQADNNVVGSTRYLNMEPRHRRLEIGGTWLAPAWQRSGINREAKYLMLRHAFEAWRCLRVEFRTNALNDISRTALQRLGAVEEGTLLKHMVQEDGTSRDSVIFRVLDDEWPAVKRALEVELG